MRVTSTPVVLFLLVLAGLTASAANAATSQTWTDRSGDAPFPYPDIAAVSITHTDDDHIVFAVGTRVLVGGDRIDVFVDVDDDPATGSGGSDIAFYYERSISGNWMSVGVWNGAAFQFVTTQTFSYQATDAVIAFSISRAELGVGTALRAWVRSGRANLGNQGTTYWDRAPDTGVYRLSWGASAGASAPAPAPAPLAALTNAQARNATGRGIRARLGKGPTPVVARTCARISQHRRRCSVNARSARHAWRGSMTVTKVRLQGKTRYRYAFAGTRFPRVCGPSCAKSVRFNGTL